MADRVRLQIKGANEEWVDVGTDAGIPVEIIAGGSSGGALGDYFLSDLDTASSPGYLGYLTTTGGWLIKQFTDTTFLYCKGTSDYATAWAGRAGLTYDIFSNIF